MHSVREVVTLASPIVGALLLNGRVERSFTAGTNVSLALQDHSVTVNVPSFRDNFVIATGTATFPRKRIWRDPYLHRQLWAHRHATVSRRKPRGEIRPLHEHLASNPVNA